MKLVPYVWLEIATAPPALLQLCTMLSMGPSPLPPSFLLFHSIARSHRLDMCDLTPPSQHFHGQPKPTHGAWARGGALQCRIPSLN